MKRREFIAGLGAAGWPLLQDGCWLPVSTGAVS
jgi:hypothetical protein